MATVVTLNRPDVVARIEALAARFTGGNKTELVAMSLAAFEKSRERTGPLFDTMRGSVKIREDVDLTAPVLEDPMDAELGIGF